MKKVLVAGGAGFVGSHLCEALLAKGYDVTIVDSLITGQRKNVEALEAKGARFIEQDITQPLKLDEPLDHIYNLASPASPVDFNKFPIFILRTGSHGHENLLNLAHEKKARILLGSTSEVYGDALVHPQSEDYFGNVNTLGERSCYDEAKRYCEALTMAYKKEKGVNVCIARIFNTYGPRMRSNDGRVMPSFFTQVMKRQPVTIYGEGLQTRSFCYVSDLVRGLILLMESDHIGPFNLGNPEEITICDLAKKILAICKVTSAPVFKPLRENDPLQRKPDITRAQQLLGWQPQVSLNEGLKLLYKSLHS